MSRLIDADELRKNVLKWMPSDPCGKEEKEFPFETDICASMVMEIDDAPTVQPDIIRCPDCYYNDGTAYCELHFRNVKAKDFCSWAERRE